MAEKSTNQQIEMILVSIARLARVLYAKQWEIAAALKETGGQRTLAHLTASAKTLKAEQQRVATLLRVLHQCHRRLVRIYES